MNTLKILGNTTKHWTNEEKEARAAAEDSLRRPETLLQIPDYVASDEVAMRFWIETLDMAEEIELYDNMDRNILGTYCLLMSRLLDLRAAYKVNRDLNIIDGKNVEMLRKTETLQLQYANRLGLTPESRARLARKRSIPEAKDPYDDLYGEA